MAKKKEEILKETNEYSDKISSAIEPIITCEPVTTYVITLVDHGVRHYLHAEAKPRDGSRGIFTPFPLSAQKFHDLRIAINYSAYLKGVYPNLPECTVMRLVLQGEIFDDVSTMDIAIAVKEGN